MSYIVEVSIVQQVNIWVIDISDSTNRNIISIKVKRDPKWVSHSSIYETEHV